MKNLVRRVERLEGREYSGSVGGFGRRHRGFHGGKPVHPPPRLRFGKVRRLPEEYRGERHIVVAKQLPERNCQEWVEFEQVPGPEPITPAPDPRLPQYLDIVLVESPKYDHNE